MAGFTKLSFAKRAQLGFKAASLGRPPFSLNVEGATLLSVVRQIFQRASNDSVEIRILKPSNSPYQLGVLICLRHRRGNLKNRVLPKVVWQPAQRTKPIEEPFVLRNRKNHQFNQLTDRIIVRNTHIKTREAYKSSPSRSTPRSAFFPTVSKTKSMTGHGCVCPVCCCSGC